MFPKKIRKVLKFEGKTSPKNYENKPNIESVLNTYERGST